MRMKTPEDRKRIRIPEDRITEVETIDTAASGADPGQNKTAADIFAEMEERRQDKIKESYSKMAEWEFQLEDAKEDMQKCENQPDKAEKYAVAEVKAKFAQRNIDSLEARIQDLKRKKIPIVTDNETKAFYEQLYAENLEELKEIAISIRDSYQFLIALTQRAEGMFVNANKLAHTWDRYISVKDSGHISGFDGYLLMPGLVSFSNDNGFYSIHHERYENVLFRLDNELQAISAALNDLSGYLST